MSASLAMHSLSLGPEAPLALGPQGYRVAPTCVREKNWAGILVMDERTQPSTTGEHKAQVGAHGDRGRLRTFCSQHRGPVTPLLKSAHLPTQLTPPHPAEAHVDPTLT